MTVVRRISPYELVPDQEDMEFEEANMHGDAFLQPPQGQETNLTDVPMMNADTPQGTGTTKYITDTCLLLNSHGFNMWKLDFPKRTDPSWKWDAKDLPLFWGIAPWNLSSHRRGDIIHRYRIAMMVTHPDKHPQADADSCRMIVRSGRRQASRQSPHQ